MARGVVGVVCRQGQYKCRSSASLSTILYRGFTSSKTNENGGSMDDEYGEMTSDGEEYKYNGRFKLESGNDLAEATLRYQTYGKLDDDRSNALVVCHALTGNASLHSWWGDLLGPNQPFDTSKYFIVCANILGSCYGSTSPRSINPDNGEMYGTSFPDISVKDTVRLQLNMLREHLNLNSIKCVIGGSFGGMQALEFAAQAGTNSNDFNINSDEPFVKSVIPIGCGVAHTAWQIAISETQRQAIYSDPKWNNGNPKWDDLPYQGLAVARQIGMISYRTHSGYQTKFGRTLSQTVTPPYGSHAPWTVKSYLEYQGQKFLSRFDPITYIKLTEQMDTHDLQRGRPNDYLNDIQIPALVLGINSDILYPLCEQEELAHSLPNAELKIIVSDAGHDGFLLEQKQVGGFITQFLNCHA